MLATGRCKHVWRWLRLKNEPDEHHAHSIRQLRGCTLSASDGDIGTVREFYFSDENWRVRYLVVDTGSWLSGRSVLLIPHVLREVDAQADAVRVSLTKEQVRNSPPLDSDRPISRQLPRERECECERNEHPQQI